MTEFIYWYELYLHGYKKGAQTKLFALRPVPIQVEWLGYLNTSDAVLMDYLIADKICSPPEFQNWFISIKLFL